MNRIQAKFAKLKTQKRKALIPYITAGDPAPKITVPLLQALVSAGADIIELGIPFSDPMADGPVIEAAHHRALAQKVSLHDVLAMVKEFRRSDNETPIVLMGYFNPFLKMARLHSASTQQGYQKFAQAAQAAGVDGVLVVDLPPEEATEWLTEMRERYIDTIFLLAPTSKPDRIKLICEKAHGYLYYVSLKGVTGSKALDVTEVAKQLAIIRKVTTLPIGVGFGIRDAQSAAEVAKIADAIIVGSALVSRLAEFKGQEQALLAQASSFIQELRTAIDSQ